jgi:hypothetical protein
MEVLRHYRVSALGACLGLVAISLLHASPAVAYDEYSHEWITRAALEYLRTHPHHYGNTDAWVSAIGPSGSFGEEALVRAVVDTDYKTDNWLSAIFHPQFAGAASGSIIALFTTMFHFLNVTVPGEYWTHDGYAYKHSTKQGNDKYLDYFTVSVLGEDSLSLGGRAPSSDRPPGTPLGVYNTGFKGTQHDWRKMFFEGNSAGDAIFPPSSVPANLAFKAMLSSSRATSDQVESWTEKLPIIKSLFSTENINRTYWRGQVMGLPSGWDLLGMVVHLSQDTTVPHHVEGTSDNCHPEYEAMLDELTCNSHAMMDYSEYYNGKYAGPRPGCGLLYDPALVEVILGENPWLYNDGGDVEARMVSLAEISAEWKWATGKNSRSTVLPSRESFEGASCAALFAIPTVMDQGTFQYNLAIAATVSIIESAAHVYEAGPDSPLALLVR